MIENQLKAILEAAGVVNGSAVVRFFKDGDSSRPRVVIQRDIQGCRVVLRPEDDPTAITCAWFDDEGCLISAEKFCCGHAELDKSRTDKFLGRLLTEPFADMAREMIVLPA